jgi:hypothetical protein
VSAIERLGPHGLVEPFEPKPRILDPEGLELMRYIVTREPPAELRPEFVAEERRRAELLIAMHEIAVEEAKRGTS